MTEISYSNDRLSIGEVTVELRHPVKDFVDIDDLVVVLLKVPLGTTDNRNIVAFDRDGKQHWTIETSDDERGDNPYMSVHDDDGALFVEAWNGIRYAVDLETGEISEGRLRRF